MSSELTKSLFDLYRKTILDFCGIQIADESLADFSKKVTERLRVAGFDNFFSYHLHISDHSAGQDELRKLVELITNNETYFFREPSHFKILKTVIIPELLRHKQQRRVKIWSAGCSSGEEVYSIAVTLHESQMLYGDFEALAVGTDIDRHALTVARLGNYGRNSFRSTDTYYLNNYFRIPDQRLVDYRVIDERIQALTRFEYLNLFETHYPDFLSDIDVIFFRNVSIYFPKDKIQTINRKISEALNPGGYLFLSSSETMHHNFGNLELTDRDGVFLYYKPKTGTPVSLPVVQSFQKTSKLRKPRNVPAAKTGKAEKTLPESEPDSGDAAFDHCFRLYRDGDYTSVLDYLGEHEKELEPKIPFLILKTFIFIGQEKFDLATEVCRVMSKLEPLHPEVFFLQGLIAYHAKNFSDAPGYLQKAIFLKKELAIAHYYLASIYLVTGPVSDAKREFKNTVKILGQKQDSSLSFMALGYSSEYLINACKQHLK